MAAAKVRKIFSLTFCCKWLIVYQIAHIERTIQILNFIRLHSLHSSSHPSIQKLNIAEEEASAIYAAVENLLGQESSEKENVISGFFAGEGDIAGVSCKLFRKIFLTS